MFSQFYFGKLVHAEVSQTFHDDFFTVDVKVVIVLHSAIESIRDTVLIFPGSFAVWASPGNRSGVEGDVTENWFHELTEVPDEVKRLVITGSVPQFNKHFVVFSYLHFELCSQTSFLPCLIICI